MYLLKGGFVVDPENDLYGKMDILVDENGKIEEIAENIEGFYEKVYSLEGKHVFPGFIDMHVHLREPGREDKENIETGLKSAAAGGFTGVAPMPNTMPVCDNRVVVEYLKNRANENKYSKLYPVGAATKGEQGQELAEIGEMYKSGIVAVTDDGVPVKNSMIMKRVFEYIKTFDLVFMAHSEDVNLALDGVMNEGEVSIKLGLNGIPNSAESVMVSRDILLCEQTKSRLHVSHISAVESVRAIKEAKKAGLNVTCEITPHHFALTDREVEKQEYCTNTKMNPPLRTKENVDKIIEYIREGVIDIITTDHAPHTEVDKNVEYNYAPFGIVGFETAVGLVLTKLVDKGVIDLKRMAEMMSINPRKIFKIDGGIKRGKFADITIVDIEKKWVVDKNNFYSKSKNTPFDGMELKGKPYMTIVDGKVTMEDGVVK